MRSTIQTLIRGNILVTDPTCRPLSKVAKQQIKGELGIHKLNSKGTEIQNECSIFKDDEENVDYLLLVPEFTKGFLVIFQEELVKAE